MWKRLRGNLTLSAGFAAIGRGQRHAALALGMTPAQALWHIVLPQTLRAILPSLANTRAAKRCDAAILPTSASAAERHTRPAS